MTRRGRTDTPPVKFCDAGVAAAGGTNVQSTQQQVGSVLGKDGTTDVFAKTYLSPYGKSLGYGHCREHLYTKKEEEVSSAIY